MKFENFSVCGCTGSVSSSESVVMKMHCVPMQSGVIHIRLRSVLSNRVLKALIALMAPLRTALSVVLTFIVLAPLMFHLSDEEKTQSLPLFQKQFDCSAVVFSECSSLDSISYSTSQFKL